MNRTMYFKMLKKEKEGKERNCQTNFDSFSSILAFLAIYQFFFFFAMECIDTLLQTLMVEPKKVKWNNVKHKVHSWVQKPNKRNPNQLLTKKLGEICFIVTYEKNRQDFKWQDTQFWLAVMCAQYNRRLVSGD